MERTLKGRLTELLYEYGHIVEEKEVLTNKILNLFNTNKK